MKKFFQLSGKLIYIWFSRIFGFLFIYFVVNCVAIYLQFDDIKLILSGEESILGSIYTPAKITFSIVIFPFIYLGLGHKYGVMLNPTKFDRQIQV